MGSSRAGMSQDGSLSPTLLPSSEVACTSLVHIWEVWKVANAANGRVLDVESAREMVQ